MTPVARQWTRIVPAVALLMICGGAIGQQARTGNIVVSIGQTVTGSSSDPDPNVIQEFSRSGALLRTLQAVHPTATYDASNYIRGLAPLADGGLFLFNGTRDAVLSYHSTSSASWTHFPIDGLTVSNGIHHGGIGVAGRYVFAPDMATAGTGSPAGLVRFDRETQTYTRFTNEDYMNLCIGWDGLLYALPYNPGGAVHVYEPNTMTYLRTVVLQGGDGGKHYSIQVNGAGHIFTSTNHKNLFHFSPSGQVIKQLTLTVRGEYFRSLALSLDGMVVAGISTGEVLTTNEGFSPVTRFTAHSQPNMFDCTMFLAFIPSPSPFDFNVDGKNDLLAHNPSTGEMAVLRMNGTYLGGSFGLRPSLPINWRIVGASDFTGDAKPDVVAQNSQTRAISILTTSQGNVTSSIPVKPILPENWRVVGVADFDKDNQADILVQNTATRQAAVLLMTGSAIRKSVSLNPTLPAGWSVRGAADFTQDGWPDILVQNGSQLALLTMVGTTIAGSKSLTPAMLPNWTVLGIEDLDGDARPDLIAQHATTNQVAIMKTDGQRIYSSKTLSSPLPGGWQIAGPH